MGERETLHIVRLTLSRGENEGGSLPCRSLTHREVLDTSSENPSWTNIVFLLSFQKTLEIYSVELSGTKDIQQTDNGNGKEKYRGLKNCFEPRKNHHKEELRKEVDLVS